jgi:hypothetical protein
VKRRKAGSKPKAEARVIVEFADARRGLYVIDVTVEEANALAARGRRVPLHMPRIGRSQP